MAMRIYLGESDRLGHESLYEALVVLARDLGLAGATVLRGPMGYGAHHRLHTEKILRLASDLPVIVEVIDREERILEVLPEFERRAPHCLITLTKLEVRYAEDEATPA